MKISLNLFTLDLRSLNFMKNKLLYILRIVIDWLEKIYNKYVNREFEKTNYHSLTPTSEVDNIEHYSKAFNWALQNKNTIKNIAVTGPYGSGKSSIIRTFQARNTNNDYHFLNISLATFKEEKNSKKRGNDDVLRLIELSILQQIFYHEADKNIPDSRLKKIKNYKKRHLWILTFGFVLFLISILILFSPDFITKNLFLEDKISTVLNLWVHYISFAIVIMGVSILTFKSIRIIKGITLKKLNFKNAEIEISDDVGKSILNSHIDEILYFFEVTEYNIVVIEDLDRFEQTEIFTKLREINLLINNSKKIIKNVVFIYAVRDDMFRDNDRTKFFDFIIPIIPVINSSNSNEILLKIIKYNNYKISVDLIDGISLFIDDMRLLYNIMNEYYLYSKNLNKKLNQSKLLSMIVYKNIYPIDFSSLSNYKGVLYGIISDKQIYIQSEIEKLDQKIPSIKEEIEKLEIIKIKDLRELRVIYISKIIEKINSVGISFKGFWINNQGYNSSEASEENIFEYLLTGSLEVIQNIHNHKRTCNIDFDTIENEVDPNISYKEREELVKEWNNNKVENLKLKIEEIEEKKERIKKYKLKDLLSSKQIAIVNDNKKQKNLISILLRNEYIDEDYLDYISIFYEGSITKTDYHFLIDVKSQKNTEFTYKLNKVEKIITKINQFEFDKEYILNYDLLDFLLANSKNKTKRDNIFSLLKDESKNSVKFIDGFIDKTTEIGTFIKILCKNWNNIWVYIENESNFTELKKEKYFKLIIEYSDVRDIKNIFNKSKSAISNNVKFLSIIKSSDKLKKVIEILDIKFIDIDTDSKSEQMFDFIYEGNYYMINSKMLKIILKHKNAFKQVDFDTKNYSLVKQSDLKTLIEYLNKNINIYVTSIYLKIEPNNNEPLKYLIELLNNDDLSIENKEKIIKQVDTIIEDLDEIENLQVINLLLNESKVDTNWDNMVKTYNRNNDKSSQSLIDFINNSDNSLNLSKKKISKDVPDKETANKFMKSILLEENILTDSYSNIVKSFPYFYNSLDYENLPVEKIRLLIDHGLLGMNDENFVKLKNNYDQMHILLIEHNINSFIKNLKTFELDEEDTLGLLKSAKISIKIKERIINYFDESYTYDSPSLVVQIGELLIENQSFNPEEIIIKSILSNDSISTTQRIKIFNKRSDLFDISEFDEIISTFDLPYSKITENRKRPLIEDNESNRKFVEILKQNGFILKYVIEKKKGIRISTLWN